MARMDAKPLRASIDRWRALIEANYGKAKIIVDDQLKDLAEGAEERLIATLEFRQRELARNHTRQRAHLEMVFSADELPGLLKALEAEHEQELEEFAEERDRLLRGVRNAHFTLQAAVAVRFVKVRHVSA